MWIDFWVWKLYGMLTTKPIVLGKAIKMVYELKCLWGMSSYNEEFNLHHSNHYLIGNSPVNSNKPIRHGPWAATLARLSPVKLLLNNGYPCRHKDPGPSTCLRHRNHLKTRRSPRLLQSHLPHSRIYNYSGMRKLPVKLIINTTA
jgi:hypothetical protein